MQRRFSREGTKPVFTQPPKPRSAAVFYDSQPRRFLFDLRDTTEQAHFAPWPAAKTASLVDVLREGAAEKLKSFLSAEKERIERVFIGRGATEADKAARLKVIPLPSIGHEHADHAIRRVLVEVPDNCPLAPEDIRWAFSGLVAASDSQTGEVLSLLVPAQDEDMLWYFGTTSGHRVWRTVTPAVLPQEAARRRIDPDRIKDRTEQKDAAERNREEARAAAAVAQALRHAPVDTEIVKAHVQREPFDRKGARAEAFADGTRFAKERLWHVEITLTKPTRGPLVIGDGRYLGLGLLAPVRERRAIFSFALGGGKAVPGQEGLIANAARRAVMARVQERLRRGEPLPTFFSGHEADGAPNRSGHHAHLFYAVDLVGQPARLLILAPHIVEHRKAEANDERNLRLLGDALEDFSF
jgi:CRISPR-associated protein Csb2